MVRVGVIGYGYWGPNVVRNFGDLPGCQVISVCDKNPGALERLGGSQSTRVTSDAREVYAASDIDAVAIVTPVSTHYELARNALENGKHVFVEKPFTANSKQAEDLIELAASKNLQIMVDHTFLFTGAVRKLKDLVDEGTFGRLLYYDSMRVNLGLFQHDVNVVWDLAPHDLSIMDHLIDEKPVAVAATGESHFGSLEDLAYITIFFGNRMIAHVNVNWLSPVKVRTTLIGGEKRMAVWNDLDADEKVKVYDKGVVIDDDQDQEGVYNLLVSYRSGDMYAPKVEQTEALKLEAQYFLDCICSGDAPINDGWAGLRVVRLLEAASESLKDRGRLVEL